MEFALERVIPTLVKQWRSLSVNAQSIFVSGRYLFNDGQIQQCAKFLLASFCFELFEHLAQSHARFVKCSLAPVTDG